MVAIFVRQPIPPDAHDRRFDILPNRVPVTKRAIWSTPFASVVCHRWSCLWPSQIVMTADYFADAAIAGLDEGEVVTVPAPPDFADWEAYEKARQNMLPELSLSSPQRVIA